ncbi:helix-turn-helix domain-containing protein [Chryseolinea lacunae]|uniref:AraC family transcriptional regulator n=1 Tax=Chryseolinea lacunae TaxID=2801331 RepID=A0ABS1L1F8_9BACT|nr:helix-turn-helix domain-containing protein [Chryseolinea lacunae]MBL0745544.1 AraC family transcriptional regulator [Chryseolinea lacunae]
MQNEIVDIKSISEMHRFQGWEKPKHPLVSVVNLVESKPKPPAPGVSYRLGFYLISCKRYDGIFLYGKSHYDFEEGSLVFIAPNQVISSSPDEHTMEEGWSLFVHPDLLNRTELGKKINDYSFFHYDANEALHVSEDEKLDLRDCLAKIIQEYSRSIDKHTQKLIVSNIDLLLSYCERFYDRQFITRAKVSNDIVQRFERLLKDYFAQDTLIERGIPEVKYFASELNVSSNYLSDLLSKYTGKTTHEHIHLQITDKAKSLLWGTKKSISEIAYELGFEHSSHFTKVFKSKTGVSPREFRNAN